MISNDRVEQAVADVLVELLGVGDDEILPSATLSEDLGADSIDMVEIAFELEERFDTEIRDDELETAKTVEDLYSLVRRYAAF